MSTKEKYRIGSMICFGIAGLYPQYGMIISFLKQPPFMYTILWADNVTSPRFINQYSRHNLDECICRQSIQIISY